jgi:hypothetical protein
MTEDGTKRIPSSELSLAYQLARTAFTGTADDATQHIRRQSHAGHAQSKILLTSCNAPTRRAVPG